MTSEVRRDACPRSSHVGGGDVGEPTCPARETSAVSGSKSALSLLSWFCACAARCANSSSVSD